jgi:hypothetical protein
LNLDRGSDLELLVAKLEALEYQSRQVWGKVVEAIASPSKQKVLRSSTSSLGYSRLSIEGIWRRNGGGYRGSGGAVNFGRRGYRFCYRPAIGANQYGNEVLKEHTLPETCL